MMLLYLYVHVKLCIFLHYLMILLKTFWRQHTVLNIQCMLWYPTQAA